MSWYGHKDFDEKGDFKAISEIKRILKPHSTILLTIPYGKGGTNWFRSYDDSRLKNLLTGFEIIESRYFIQSEAFWKETDKKTADNSDNSKVVHGITTIKAKLI